MGLVIGKYPPKHTHPPQIPNMYRIKPVGEFVKLIHALVRTALKTLRKSSGVNFCSILFHYTYSINLCTVIDYK